MNMFHVLLYLIVLIHLSSSWTQQYGDAASTSYVDYKGPAQKNWNYTTGLPAESSPSVSRNGVIFYPLRMSVIALSSSGSVLWETAISDNGKDFISNTLYSEKHDLVIVGGSVDEVYYQIVGLHASSGDVAWKSKHNNVSNFPTTLSISTSADAVCAGGSESGTLVALRLVDGSLLWQRKGIDEVQMLMQTKIGPISTTPLGNEIVLVPTAPYYLNHHHGDYAEKRHNGKVDVGNGRLYAFDTLDNTTIWYSDVGFSAGGLFALSGRGLVYGLVGGMGGEKGQTIFGLHIINGSLVFSNRLLCGPESDRACGMAGPTVDVDGNAYYSCGDQMFSVYSNGSLRWRSKQFGRGSVNSVVSPSLHPSGYVYFIHNNQTRVIALSTVDGSLHKVYVVPELGYFEPPILLGSSFMYLIGLKGGATNMSINLVNI